VRRRRLRETVNSFDAAAMKSVHRASSDGRKRSAIRRRKTGSQETATRNDREQNFDEQRRKRKVLCECRQN
jgi:hypothetical protein